MLCTDDMKVTGLLIGCLRMREENGVFFKPVFKIKDKYMIYDDPDRSGYI